MESISTPFFVAYLVAGLVVGTAAFVLAGRKGQNRQLWSMLGFAGGVLFVVPGIIVLVLLALKSGAQSASPQRSPAPASPAQPPAPAQPSAPSPQVEPAPPSEAQSAPPQFQAPPTLQMPVGPQAPPSEPSDPEPGEKPASLPQFQAPPTLQMPVGPQAPPSEPSAPDSEDTPASPPQFQSPPTLQMPVGPQTPPMQPPSPQEPAAGAPSLAVPPGANLRPYSLDAQGLDAAFKPNGSYDHVQLGMLTGTQVAERVKGIDNLPAYYNKYAAEDVCAVVVYFRRNDRYLDITLEKTDEWRCATPPAGVPDKFTTSEIADWVERAWVSLEQRGQQT